LNGRFSDDSFSRQSDKRVYFNNTDALQWRLYGSGFAETSAVDAKHLMRPLSEKKPVTMLQESRIIHYYNRYVRELLHYLITLTKNQEMAEDLLHDTFANLIEYAQTRAIKEETIRAFLYKTAHNLAVNYMQRKQKGNTLDIDDMAETLPGRDHHHAINTIEADELNKRVYRYLETVDPRDRSIFILHKELGKSHVEIAEDLGVSERTVRRRMKALLSDLLSQLGKDGFL
jgi:RNA polymerase sigma-70 factor (ECF subfamily)